MRFVTTPPAPLARLLAHLRWADERILHALRATGGEPADALRIFAHVLGAEHVWLARLHEREPEAAVWPALGVEACARLARANADALEAYAVRLSGDDLARTVRYRNTAGQEFDTPVEDILLHVAMHGSYHRGQVNLLLRRSGAEPAPVDYVAFVRM